jgi:beta-lactamase class A
MRAIQIALSAIVALCVASALAQSSPPATLKEQLDAIARGTTGTLGYSLHHLKTGERLDRLGDELFPTDSTLKVAIMAAAMERVVSGNQPYGALRTLVPDDRNAGGFFNFFRDGTEIEFREALHQMIAQSDNTATMMTMRWIGGAKPVNEWLQSHGLKKTRLIVQYPISDEQGKNEHWIAELKADIAKWGMGVSTPNEMRELMEMIADGRAGSPAAVDEMWRILTHQYFDGGIGSQIPPWISVASKSGRSPRTRSGLGIVNSPSGIYVLTIFAQGGADPKPSWQDEVSTSIRAISKAVWRHFHPTDKWEPPPGAERLW